MIGVIDYACGNLTSLGSAFRRIGADFQFLTTPTEIEKMTGLVLPGVGHFGHAVRNIDDLGLREPLLQAAGSGIHVLGICLGMQLLFERSDEAGSGSRGLGLISGSVRSLKALGVQGRVPHIGWNELVLTQAEHPLFHGLHDGDDVYFVHSYAAVPALSSDCAATCEYEVTFTAAAARDHVAGVQFHPEKSSTVGRKLLENFCELAC